MDLHLALGSSGPAIATGRQPLASDWDALKRAPGAPAWEDYLTLEDTVPVRDGSEFAAQAWRLRGGEDFTEFEGVSLGLCFRWLIWVLTALPAYKAAAALQRAAKRHDAGNLYVERVPYPIEAAAKALSAAGGPKFQPVEGVSDGPGLLSWSMPNLTLNSRKVFAAKLFNAAASLRGDVRPPLLVSYYPTLDGVLDRALDPSSPFRVFMADMPNRRFLPRLAARGGKVLLDARSAPTFTPAQRARLVEIRKDWAAAKADPTHRARFSIGGVELFDSFSPAVDRFLEERLEALAWTCLQFQRLWDQTPPAAVLMAYNEGPLQHLLGQIARQRGTPAVTMLHGLAQGERLQFGENNTSHFFVWGPEQRELFARTDSLKCDCRPTGSPHFDRYPKNLPRRPAAAPLKVMVLSSPVCNVIERSSALDAERYGTAVLNILGEFSQFETTMKIHPAESLPRYEKLTAGRKVTLVKDRPILDCLLEADLVIGPFSTVLIEAMILGKPLICVNGAAPPFPLPFDGKWGVPTLRPGPELRAVLERIAREPEKTLSELTAPYPKILEQFVGPLDGRRAEHVLSELAKLARKEPS